MMFFWKQIRHLHLSASFSSSFSKVSSRFKSTALPVLLFLYHVLCDCHPKNPICLFLPAFTFSSLFLLPSSSSYLFLLSPLCFISLSFLSFFFQNFRLRRKGEFVTEKRIQSQRKESHIMILLLLRHFFHQQL